MIISFKRFAQYVYFTPLGKIFSFFARMILLWQRPRMIYGYTDPASKSYRPGVRIGSTVVIEDRENLTIGDHVWIWHHSILDATGGVEIGEGCQIGAWVGIFTHSSHNAIRLMGKDYIRSNPEKRLGFIKRPVKIGAFTFISSGAVIMPGVTIGRGCVIGPNTLVMQDVPDHTVLIATPGRQFGTTTAADLEFFRSGQNAPAYYDENLKAELMKDLSK